MNDNLNEVIDQINKAFYKLESYMNSKIDNYQYFGFDLAFTKLFTKGKMSENFTYENCKLISQYWHLLERLRYDLDQGNYEAENILENEGFEKDAGEIEHLAWDRCEEFSQFQTSDEIAKEEAELSFSITDIINTNISKPPKQKNRTTYQWQNNADKELPELYSLMINEYKLIAPNTTLEQFTAIFTGQSIDGIKPIRWHQNNATELLYFIIRLEQLNNVAHNSKRADYTKLKACFVDPDGQEFKAKWKSLKTNIQINLSPEKQNAIDKLVQNF